MVAKIIEKQKVKKAATGEESENKENESPPTATRSKVKQALRMKCNEVCDEYLFIKSYLKIPLILNASKI